MLRTVQILKCLGEENRFRIALMLRERPMCVCELAAVVDIALSTLSSHLKQLSQAGVACSAKDGRWILYRVSADPFVGRILELIAAEVGDEELMAADLARCRGLDRAACALAVRGGKGEAGAASQGQGRGR